MTIEFRCPGCHKLLRVSDEAEGKTAQCPECGSVSQVPAAQRAVASFAASSGHAAASENPFQSPQAVDAGGATIAAAPAPIVPTPLDIGDVMSRSWEVFQQYWGILVGAYFLTVVLEQLFGFAIGMSGVFFEGDQLQLLSVALQIAAQIFSIYIAIGFTRIALDAARGQDPEIATLFAGGPWLLPAIGGSILFGLMLVGGFLLLIVPGVFVYLFFWPYWYLIVDNRTGVLESFSVSRELNANNKASVFVLTILGIGISLLGLLACVVGLLVALPLVSVIYSVMYLRISGQPIMERASTSPRVEVGAGDQGPASEGR